MGKVYRIKPNTKTYYEEIEADSPKEALEKFADQMDSDMGSYFEAEEKLAPATQDEVLDIFMANASYDEADLAMFRSNNPLFKGRIEELLEEREGFESVFAWESYVVDRVTAALNLAQYGNTSDSGDLEKIGKDLVKRGLGRRYFV